MNIDSHVAVIADSGNIVIPLNGFVPKDLDTRTATIPGRRQTLEGWEWGFSREVLERLHLDLHLGLDAAGRAYLAMTLPEPDPQTPTRIIISDQHAMDDFPWFAATRGRAHQYRFKLWRRGYGLDGRLHRGAMLEAGKGLGKTLSAIEEILELMERRSSPRVLVLARNANVRTVWAQQIEEHAAGLPYTVLGGSRVKRLEELRATLKRGGPHVFIHNHEDLPGKVDGNSMGKLLAKAAEWDLAVLDESARFRSASARRTRLLTGAQSVELRADTKLALTGLPIVKRTTDIYPVMKWLGAPTGNKEEFTERFLMTGDYGKEIAIKDVVGLNRLLDHYRFVVPKGSVLDLPRNWHYDRVVLKPWQKQVMARVRKELKTIFVGPDGKVDEKMVANRLGEMLRLAQVASGLEAIDTEHFNWRDDNAKTEHLLHNVLPDFEGEKVVVWMHWRPEVAATVRLTRAAGWDAVGFYGGQNEAANTDAYQRFTAGTADLFIANTVMGGHGLNLPMAHTMIYVTRTFDTEAWQQSLDRNSRLSTDPGAVLNVVVLEADDPIDEGITRTLGDDMRRASQVTALDVAAMLGL